MGKFNQGILGGFVGKVGNVVGYRSRGEWLYRSYQKIVSNPKSEAQTKRRELFAIVSKQIASGCRANLTFLKKTGYEKNTWYSALVQAGMYLDAWGRNDVKTLGNLAQKNYFARGTDMWNLGSMLAGYEVTTGVADIVGWTQQAAGEHFFNPALNSETYNNEYFDSFGKSFNGFVMFLNVDGLPQICSFVNGGDGMEIDISPTNENTARCGWQTEGGDRMFTFKASEIFITNSPGLLSGSTKPKIPASNGKMPVFMFFTSPSGEPIGSCFQELPKIGA